MTHTHTVVLSYRHHRLNCRHSFLSDMHGAAAAFPLRHPTPSIFYSHLLFLPLPSPSTAPSHTTSFFSLPHCLLSLFLSSFLPYLCSHFNTHAGTLLHLNSTHFLPAFTNSTPPPLTHTHIYIYIYVYAQTFLRPLLHITPSLSLTFCPPRHL